MKPNKNLSLIPPQVFNIFKPAKMSSYDVVRHFKRNLPTGYGKIGHFGTLDPFASGVLMIGIGGAARLNEYIHELLPKTYLAVGKLGIETPTGDHQSEIIQRDDSVYLKKEIASFSREFIEEKIREKFVGDYMQAPHKYSAAKFMGRNLHVWAREGVEVKKEAVKRHIYSIDVVKYAFPYLSIRVKVSSGTYVRTLFSDMSNYLGTLGSLIALVRESVGHVSTTTAIHMKDWAKDKEPEIMGRAVRIDEVLDFSKIELSADQTKAFQCGAFLKPDQVKMIHQSKISKDHFWIFNTEGDLVGLSYQYSATEIRPKINFHLEDQA